VAVLTGAGCSTESGIPDYRGPETLRRARRPVQFRQFIESAAWRQRYWARAAQGWSLISNAEPNPAHLALADLEQRGRLCGLITQNVDRLHQAAGSHDVIELHGALAEVICLACGRLSLRAALQQRLIELNPGWFQRPVEAAPDGDAELEQVEGFRVADCLACGGLLKPHVVFFGENVPRARVESAWARVHEAEALLVVGSSLTVFSGYRFVKGAAERGLPIAILNQGPTRGDKEAALKLELQAGPTLTSLALAL
jgi:NAD-dependent SIR2 family protein deacetylase